MGTDWKKSKLAARILCGWLGVMCLLAAALCLMACGPAMLGGSAPGMGDLLAGQLSGSVIYQQKMAQLFYNCSLLAAGGASGDGMPLTASQNAQLRSQARDALNNDSGALSSGQVLFAVLPDSESGVSYSNTDFALWEDGRVAAPLGYSVALASTSGSSWGNRALLAAYTRLLTSQTVHPSAEGLENAVVVLAVQDGARPLVTPALIDRTVEAAAKCGAAAPAVPVKDTIKTVAEDGAVTGTPDRSTLRAVQTPQVFEADLLKAALQSALENEVPVTDDCSAVERLGKVVYLIDGDEENLKITTPVDLVIAEAILAEREGR